MEFASKALVIDNTDYQIHYIMGTAYTAKKEYEKAVASLLEGLKLKPDHALMYNNLGSCYLALKMIKEAQEAFEKQLSLITPMQQAITIWQLLFNCSKSTKKLLNTLKNLMKLNHPSFICLQQR